MSRPPVPTTSRADDPAPPHKPVGKAEMAESLEFAASFDKPSYRTLEPMHIRFTVTNPTAEPTQKLWVTRSGGGEPDSIRVESANWGALSTGGATIPAGGSLSVDLVGLVANPEVTIAVLAGFVRDSTGASSREFRFTTAVTPSFGQVSGVVYGDRNNNSRHDPGEELAGYTVFASNDYELMRATTDESGAFELPRVTLGRVTMSVGPTDSWRFGSETITLDENGVHGLRLRGVPSLSRLTAHLAFTKYTYKPGEIARVRITLANTGPFPMGGVVADCNRARKEYGLTGSGPGWHELVGGVTVGAHTTRSFTVSEAVPQAARTYGAVAVECEFTYADAFDNRSPKASDHAAVPNGGFGSVSGWVLRYPESPKVPPGFGFRGARVVLVGESRCPIVGERRTGTTGHFAFRHVPAGHYRLFVVAPKGWYISNEWAPERVAGNPSEVMIPTNGSLYPMSFEVKRGSGPAPMPPEQPAGCTPSGPAAPTGPVDAADPAPRGTAEDGLAQTGATVLASLLAALVLLAIGFAGVVAGRRRKTLRSANQLVHE